jgi:hypothetical protein
MPPGPAARRRLEMRAGRWSRTLVLQSLRQRTEPRPESPNWLVRPESGASLAQWLRRRVKPPGMQA